MQKKTKKTALFSLYNLDRCSRFARSLIRLGWEIVATKETHRHLTKSRIRAVHVADYVGVKDAYPFPPTLHPVMEHALTARKGKVIGLVYDTTYPRSKGIDVGGHALLALAAKGGRIVVCDPDDMVVVLDQLAQNRHGIGKQLKRDLIKKAFQGLSDYYASAADKDAAVGKPLLHGENPYQKPAYYYQVDRSDPLAIGQFRKIYGETPCYTNIADLDSVLTVMCALHAAFIKHYNKTPHIVIAAKHGNPCGLAVDWCTPEKAIQNALWGNPKAIWGGEVVVNFPITGSLAQLLRFSSRREVLLGSGAWMLDLVAAPRVNRQAVGILGKNLRRKIFVNSALQCPVMSRSDWSLRMVRGGFLRQPPNNYVVDLSRAAQGLLPTGKGLIDSLFVAWASAWFSNHGGNEIALVRDRSLIGIGGGPSTIDACTTAIARARENGHVLEGAVFAADAFFPFTDVPGALVGIGCSYGMVPKGGKHFSRVKGFFRKHGVPVIFVPELFRGFCRH